MNRRAQFFLLAAVIISAIVISLGITANRATVNKEPASFYDSSYELRRESGVVLDYEIYNDSGGEAYLLNAIDLPEASNLLIANMLESNPDANLKVIYGNNKRLIEKDFTATIGSSVVISSFLCSSKDYCQDVSQTVETYNGTAGTTITTIYNESTIGDNEWFNVNFGGTIEQFKIVPTIKYHYFIWKMGDGEIYVSSE